MLTNVVTRIKIIYVLQNRTDYRYELYENDVRFEKKKPDQKSDRLVSWCVNQLDKLALILIILVLHMK